jgi:SM-20-related protein
MSKASLPPPASEGPIALSPALDVEALRAAFARTGRLHIPNILTPDAAERVATALEAHPSWSLTANAAGETFEMPLTRLSDLDPAERARLKSVTADGSLSAVQYAFETWRVGFLADRGHRTGGPVEALYDFINAQPYLDFIRAVTGDPRAAFCDAQATRYRPGHFLTAHDDVSAGKHRLFAYVLNFTRRWRPDWGGLLQFYDAEGHVETAFSPAFNALNLFTVPQNHAVSYVAPFAAADRLSVTGWVRARPGKPD